uniref:SEA domain-containing protein n=1 Tax=Timema bartmani TaxID=61472 RepID=A0A7R9EW36_9NEOP|nr:unnamed protein product [Timema bartmani]
MVLGVTLVLNWPAEYGEIRAQIPVECTKVSSAHPYTPIHDFHAMDCTDIIIGSARATEPTDHSIERDLMHVIWAQGQEPNKYVHSPKSGLERDFASVKDFYRQDELKYHGHKDQRGKTTLNFFEETTHMSATSAVDDPSICGGHWRTPQDCTPELGNCEYFAKWEHLYKNDELRFTVQTKNTETWTGIGFSNDTSMDVSFTEKNCVYFMFPVEGGDFHPVNKKIRKHNRVPSISAERICIKPCRPEEMVVLSTTPAPPRLSYNVEVMLENLGESFQVPSPGSTEYEDLASTVSSGFGSVLKKLPGFYKLSVDQFKDTHGKVIAKMNLIVDKAQFEKGRSLETESVNPVEKALLDTVSTGRVGALTVNPEYLVFEPQELTSSIPVEESPDRGGVLLSTTKLYIVIGCIGALVLIAVIQAACTIYRTVRNPATHNKEPRANSTPVTPLHPTFTLVLGSLALPSLGGTDTCSDHLIPSSAWKDYSAANTNYAFEAFESEEKPTGPAGGSTNNPTSNGASRAQGVNPHKPLAAMAQHNGYQTPGGPYQDTRSLQRPRGAYQTPGQMERATYSLPRTSAHPGPAGHRNGYYTQDRNRGPPRPHSELQPDFYFMPSQRKYSGEVVRVYVDYNK